MAVLKVLFSRVSISVKSYDKAIVILIYADGLLSKTFHLDYKIQWLDWKRPFLVKRQACWSSQRLFMFIHDICVCILAVQHVKLGLPLSVDTKRHPHIVLLITVASLKATVTFSN